MKSSGKYSRGILSSSLSQYCNGWGAVAGQEEEEPSVVVVDATADCGEDKKRRISLGRSSLPSPVGPRQGHLASGAMHPPLLHFSFSLSLFLSRSRTRLIHRHRSTSATPCYVAARDSGCFSPSICHSARRQAGRQVTQLQPSLSFSLSAFCATRMSRDFSLPLSSPATPSYRRGSVREMRLSFLFSSR